MSELTPSQKLRIIRRRGYICDADGRKHQAKTLEIHHKDRNRKNNDPSNVRVLCKDHHDKLHKRAGY